MMVGKEYAFSRSQIWINFFVVVLFDKVLVCSFGWPETQRSTCLSSARIKGLCVCYHGQSILRMVIFFYYFLGHSVRNIKHESFLSSTMKLVFRIWNLKLCP